MQKKICTKLLPNVLKIGFSGKNPTDWDKTLPIQKEKKNKIDCKNKILKIQIYFFVKKHYEFKERFPFAISWARIQFFTLSTSNSKIPGFSSFNSE